MKTILVKNLVLFIIFFVIYSIYFNIKPSDWEGLEHSSNSIIDGMYFGLATHSTTGYGDIHPVSKIGKLLTALHMLSVFVINIL